jgi:hypothetical protein
MQAGSPRNDSESNPNLAQPAERDGPVTSEKELTNIEDDPMNDLELQDIIEDPVKYLVNTTSIYI